MNELFATLQRALARQRAFVADASHELRTPLAVLRGELELASRPGRDRDELAAAVRSAVAEAERLARLTDDLLLLAKSDEDRLSLRRERTDIGELLARSARLAGSRLAAAGIACRVDIRAGTYADVGADRIRQAVDNLVDNALRFAPGGSAIVLAAVADRADLDIEVRDAGPGLPDGFLPYAFERFRRPGNRPGWRAAAPRRPASRRRSRLPGGPAPGPYAGALQPCPYWPSAGAGAGDGEPLHGGDVPAGSRRDRDHLAGRGEEGYAGRPRAAGTAGRPAAIGAHR